MLFIWLHPPGLLQQSLWPRRPRAPCCGSCVAGCYCIPKSLYGEIAWLVLISSVGWWASQRLVAAQLDSLAANAEYEAKTTARIMDCLFTEMASMANMVVCQGLVIQLAKRYRDDPPDLVVLTRQQRAAQFTRDPLVRKVGDFMNELSSDLRYARIYMNNMSDDMVIASNWTDADSIVGLIYSDRPYPRRKHPPMLC